MIAPPPPRSVPRALLTAILAAILLPAPLEGEGLVTSEGDAILRADLARAVFGASGAGIRVGVISDGVAGLRSSKLSGDLPADLCGSGGWVDPDLCRGIGADLEAGAEGTAMLEIVHDLAPDAQLFFCAPATSIDMVECIHFLSAEAGPPNARRGTPGGVDVIVDDLGFFLEPYFEDGMIAEAYAEALASGVVIASATGNEALIHHEKLYTPLFGAGPEHDFGGGDGRLRLHAPNQRTMTVILQWSNPFGAAGDDYDLYLFDEAGALMTSSASVQDGDDDPLEIVTATCFQPGGCAAELEIWKASGRPQELELFALGVSSMEHVVVEDSVFGHPAVEGVLAAAAIRASDPGHDTVEFFSSRGPSTIYFPFFEQRAKPDLAAIDGVAVTGNGGFPSPFLGTSAAAPHLAALAALVLEIAPAFTPDQVAAALKTAAVALGAPIPNATSGYGRADALAALNGLLIRGTSLNGPAFRASETLVYSIEVENPGAAMIVDFYFGAVLPDGDTILFATDPDLNAARGLLSDVSTLTPFLASVDLAAAFSAADPAFFTYTWNGTEPGGDYLIFLAATLAGALADGSIDPGDLVDLEVAPFRFVP